MQYRELLRLYCERRFKQISGTSVMAEVFKAKADMPDHLAGLLLIDDSGVQGPRATAEFDVTLTKAFTTLH